MGLHTKRRHSGLQPPQRIPGIRKKRNNVFYDIILRFYLSHDFHCNANLCTGIHKKTGNLKNPTKIEEIQQKNLLTEIEQLQLAF